MAWSSFRDAMWPSAPDSETPSRRPPMEPGKGQDGFTTDLPPPRDRPRPEPPADRPSSWEPVDVPEPDGDYDRPGEEAWFHAASPRGYEERNQ